MSHVGPQKGWFNEVSVSLQRNLPRAFSGSLGALASDDDDEDSEALEVTRVRSRPRSVQDLDELTPAARERIAQFVKDDCSLTSTSYLGDSEDETTLSENGRGNGHLTEFPEGTSAAKELGYQVHHLLEFARVLKLVVFAVIYHVPNSLNAALPRFC